MSTQQAQPGLGFGSNALLGETHAGMKISAEGILGRIRDGRYNKGLNYSCGVMLAHLDEMAARFYAGDAKAVDAFLQLYCLDDKRPQTPNAPLTSREAVALNAELGAPPRYVVVRDMNYTGEVMAGEWDGQFYVLADGDCYSGERLADEYGAEFSDAPNVV